MDRMSQKQRTKKHNARRCEKREEREREKSISLEEEKSKSELIDPGEDAISAYIESHRDLLTRLQAREIEIGIDQATKIKDEHAPATSDISELFKYSKEVFCFCSMEEPPFGTKIKWYAIGVSADKRPPFFTLDPFCTQVAFLSYTSVAVGSHIYSLGSGPLCGYSNLVFLLDMRVSRPNLERGPSMLSPRSFPHAWVINGKIYVLGGLPPDSSHPLVEFFDKGSWKSTRCPYCPGSHWFIHVSAFLDWKREIVMGSIYNRDPHSQCFYRYFVDSDSWEPFDDENFLQYAQHCHGQAFVHDRTCYWFDNNLVAYDFNSKMWFMGPVVGLEKLGVRSLEFFPLLSRSHSRDDLFVLTWLGECSSECSKSQCMFRTNFYVSKNCIPGKDCGSLDAFVVDYSTYLFEPGAVAGMGLLLNRTDWEKSTENLLNDDGLVCSQGEE